VLIASAFGPFVWGWLLPRHQLLGAFIFNELVLVGALAPNFFVSHGYEFHASNDFTWIFAMSILAAVLSLLALAAPRSKRAETKHDTNR
jgi:hypothetical protein